MSFDKGIKQTESMKARAMELRACKAREGELVDRQFEQVEAVNKAEEKLAKLVNARKCKSDDPEEIRKANRVCKAQAQKVEEEREILDAIQTAVRNADEQVSNAGNSLAASIRHAISSAAQATKDQVREKLYDAMHEYFAVHYALKGTLIGAQYEVEQMSYDNSLGKDAGQRISEASRKLREAVNASA